MKHEEYSCLSSEEKFAARFRALENVARASGLELIDQNLHGIKTSVAIEGEIASIDSEKITVRMTGRLRARGYTPRKGSKNSKKNQHVLSSKEAYAVGDRVSVKQTAKKSESPGVEAK